MSYSKRRQLSPTFQPGPYDVICARGKTAHAHEGNKRFRELVQLYRHRYAEAATKYEKSQIVSHITNIVRTNSPEGGFVKQFKDGGSAANSYSWYEVGDRAAKEKIGQTMRDQLHTKYSSSTKAKARVRIQKRVQEYNNNNEAAASVVDDVKSSVSVISTDSAANSSCGTPDSVPSLIQVNKGRSEMPPLRPSLLSSSKTQMPSSSLGMFIPTTTTLANNNNYEPSGESLLDALYDESNSNNNDDPLPLEPISMPTVNTNVVEFHDSDLMMIGVGQEDLLLDFCNTMGIAC